MKAALVLALLLALGIGAGAGAAWLLPALPFWPADGDGAAPGDGDVPGDGTMPPDIPPAAPDTTPLAAATAADAAAGESAGTAVAGGGLPQASAIREGAEYQRFDDPFLVPLVRDDRLGAMMVLTLGLEIAPGQAQLIRSREPRLRNQLLQALFDHANTGGFDGMFTGAANMRALRETLTRAARDVLGDTVGSVLVLDMVRQEG